MPSSMQRICLASGGTGGHLMPALVLARAMLDHGCEPAIVTEGRDVERELVQRELPDVPYFELPRSPRGAWRMPFWLVRATVAARRELRRRAIVGVVSTGGRASVPVALAARSLRLPLFLLEQNAVTGRANRYLSPLARRVYYGLPSIHDVGSRALLTGTPLRVGIGGKSRDAARRELGLASEIPVVLVTGGSQGARVLNELVPLALAATRRRVQVLHLAGLGNDQVVRHCYAAASRDNALSVRVRPVAADMDRLYAAADLVVCRGGGTTVAELALAGRAAVVVPYPHHKDRQQFHNAQVLERAGAALVFEEAGLDVAALGACLEALLADPARLAAMGEQARSLGRADAAGAILTDLLNVVRDPRRSDVHEGPRSTPLAPLAGGGVAGGRVAGGSARGGSARGGVA